MKHIIKNISGVLLAAVVFTACNKERGPLSDLKAGIPVSVSNAIAFRPEPTVSTTIAPSDSIITVTLAIPKSSGRTIAAISKVALSTSYAQIQSTGATGFYPYGTVELNGASVTFKTNIREYYLNKALNATTNPAPAANKELTFRYYFKITLDDGTVLIPESVRVLVL